jgi:hypothetical protein
MQPPFLIGFKSALSGKLRLATAPSEFAGHEVGLVLPQGAKDIACKSQLARTLYHGTYRQMVRGLQVVSGPRGKVTGE